MDQKPLLHGIRVLELSVGAAVPWVTKHMAYYGAEIIRAESIHTPDAARTYVPPWNPKLGIQPTMAPHLHEWNSGKRFIALDRRTPQAPELIGRLASVCDIVAVNLAASTIEKAQLSYDELKKYNPAVIVLHTTGFGMTGPFKDYLAWGPTIESFSGNCYMNSYPGGKPSPSVYAYPDFFTPFQGIIAVMSALEHRAKTGKGQYIEISMLESTVQTLAPVIMDYFANGRIQEGQGNREPGAAPHGAYRCKGEDRWCVIGVFNDQDWQTLCRVIGHAAWAKDPRFSTLQGRLEHQDELDAIIEKWTLSRTPEEIMEALQKAGVTAGVVQTVPDMAFKDPHLAARRFYREFDHATKGKVLGTGLGIRLEEPCPEGLRTGIDMGGDDDYVFRELLGLTSREVDSYVKTGTIEVDNIKR